MVPGRVALKALNFGVLLNRSSGGCDATAETTVGAILAETGLVATAVENVPGEDVDDALIRLSKCDLGALIVLGGDGTIRSAAELCSKSDIPLIALPGGTMNMLPRALYGERSWQDALRDTLAAPQLAAVGAGEAGGHRFFCAAIFGTPAHWAEAREALRKSHFREALQRAYDAYRRSFSMRLRYTMGAGEPGRATAVAVICPLISKVMPSDTPALEMAALNTRDLGEAFALALTGMFTDWRLASQVTTVATRGFTIGARRSIPAILDGERVTLKRAVEITFVPDAFQALVPEGSPILVSAADAPTPRAPVPSGPATKPR